jgi:hypothetical protein
MEAVTAEEIALRLAEIRRPASAFGISAVAPQLEATAQEALNAARTDEVSALARQLLAEARRARYGQTILLNRL